MHSLVFKKGVGKYVSILVPANRPGHKIREIGGYRYKSRFFRKRDGQPIFKLSYF